MRPQSKRSRIEARSVDLRRYRPMSMCWSAVLLRTACTTFLSASFETGLLAKQTFWRLLLLRRHVASAQAPTSPTLFFSARSVVTVVFCSQASSSAATPASPILLSFMEMTGKVVRWGMASAKAMAPAALMLLPSRSSFVSLGCPPLASTLAMAMTPSSPSLFSLRLSRLIIGLLARTSAMLAAPSAVMLLPSRSISSRETLILTALQREDTAKSVRLAYWRQMERSESCTRSGPESATTESMESLFLFIDRFSTMGVSKKRTRQLSASWPVSFILRR
mmetsp:Transcript_16678/g.65161  ORF Transcript_16678/g.65161 Transcript_16678/m.65161 type:complete len:278 (-) Transcript_16678:1270-2103(-)